MSTMLVVLVCALILVVVANHTLATLFMRGIARQELDEARDDYEPTVTIITPMFNEGAGIRATIASLVAQRYPRKKLNILIVDDCSTDDSFEHAKDEARRHPHVTVLRNELNMGKRRSINRAVRHTDAEIIVSIDSDVVVDPEAVRQLVRRFVTDDIAAVGGRVDIRNKADNWLTRMQTIKYFFGWEVVKTLERAHRSVFCLSGCLTAYRRSVLVELESILEQRNMLNVPIKYGEDRFLTRQILKAGYQTTLTMDAVCRTEAPTEILPYIAQQLRWRRSNLMDYFGGLAHVWRMHPVVAIHFFSLFALLFAYPALLIQSIAHGWFWPLMAVHVGGAGVAGMIYRWFNRARPAHDRVSTLSFLPIAFIIPITYAVLPPLALLTLDSGSWETRGHDASETVDAVTPTPALPLRGGGSIQTPALPLARRGRTPGAHAA